MASCSSRPIFSVVVAVGADAVLFFTSCLQHWFYLTERNDKSGGCENRIHVWHYRPSITRPTPIFTRLWTQCIAPTKFCPDRSEFNLSLSVTGTRVYSFVPPIRANLLSLMWPTLAAIYWCYPTDHFAGLPMLCQTVSQSVNWNVHHKSHCPTLCARCFILIAMITLLISVFWYAGIHRKISMSGQAVGQSAVVMEQQTFLRHRCRCAHILYGRMSAHHTASYHA